MKLERKPHLLRRSLGIVVAALTLTSACVGDDLAARSDAAADEVDGGPTAQLCGPQTDSYCTLPDFEGTVQSTENGLVLVAEPDGREYELVFPDGPTPEASSRAIVWEDLDREYDSEDSALLVVGKWEHSATHKALINDLGCSQEELTQLRWARSFLTEHQGEMHAAVDEFVGGLAPKRNRIKRRISRIANHVFHCDAPACDDAIGGQHVGGLNPRRSTVCTDKYVGHNACTLVELVAHEFAHSINVPIPRNHNSANDGRWDDAVFKFGFKLQDHCADTLETDWTVGEYACGSGGGRDLAGNCYDLAGTCLGTVEPCGEFGRTACKNLDAAGDGCYWKRGARGAYSCGGNRNISSCSEMEGEANCAARQCSWVAH